MSKRQIALMVSLMFAVPAGVVALEQAASEWSAEATEPAQETAAATEPVAEAQPAGTDAQATETAAVQEAPQPEIAAAPAPQPQRPFLSVRGQVADEPGAALLPSQVAYFDRLERSRGPLVARGDVFPAGSPMNSTLPSQVAYLDRVEQTRLAALQPQRVASAEPTPAAAESGQAGAEALVTAHNQSGR